MVCFSLIGTQRRKMAGTANSNDLEIPGGEKSRIYFLRLSFSTENIDVGDLSVSEGRSTAAEQLKPKGETNRRCHWKIQI